MRQGGRSGTRRALRLVQAKEDRVRLFLGTTGRQGGEADDV
jgi:hypothetical protein